MSRMIRQNAGFMLAVLGWLLCAPAFAAEAANAPAIRFGVSPWFSTNVQFQQRMIEPLAAEIRSDTRLAVKYLSAADNVQFTREAIDGHYDVLFVSSHIAAILVTDHGFKPILGFHVPRMFAVYMLKDAAGKDIALAGLKGKRIALPDEFGLTTAYALDVFQQQGLVPGNVDIRYEKYDHVVLQLFRREVDAIVLNPLVEKYLEPGMRERIVQLYRSPELDLALTNVYLLAPQLAPDRARTIEAAIVRYHKSTVDRSGIAREGRYVMYDVKAGDIEAASRYADRLRLRLKGSVADKRSD